MRSPEHQITLPLYLPDSLCYVVGIKTETEEAAEQIYLRLVRWPELRRVVRLLKKGNTVGAQKLIENIMEGT